MLRQTFHILWLLFATLWFAVIAPGHTRGTIRMDGSANRPGISSAMSTCCPMTGTAASQTPQKHHDADTSPHHDKSHQHAPSDPAACCAICYLNSILDIPPAVMFVTYCTGLLAELEPLEPVSLTSRLVALIHQIRGPPAVLA